MILFIIMLTEFVKHGAACPFLKESCDKWLFLARRLMNVNSYSTPTTTMDPPKHELACLIGRGRVATTFARWRWSVLLRDAQYLATHEETNHHLISRVAIRDFCEWLSWEEVDGDCSYNTMPRVGNSGMISIGMTTRTKINSWTSSQFVIIYKISKWSVTLLAIISEDENEYNSFGWKAG